ncbi:MAG: FG-GAP-like repeat-containing protein, partial [Pricia sp.]
WRDIFITNGFLKDVNDLDFVNYDDTNPFGNQKKRDSKAYLESLKTQKGIHIPNYLFQNQGNLTFKDKSEEWGFDTPTYSNGAVYADFDNDGDLDMAINNINESASIYENHTITPENQDNNYLQIVLQGEAPNKQAIGAKILFETSKGTLSHINHRTRGFMSSLSTVANFGLGQDTIVKRIDITWPDGSRQSIDEVKCNQRITIAKESSSTSVGESDDVAGEANLLNKSLFRQVEIPGLDYEHKELPFNDFNHQLLLPHQLSKFGPSLAVGDVDGNGLEDIHIGAANGSAGKLFFQEVDGTFSRLQIEDTLSYEDQGSLLLDIDNDHDLDLYIVSGGVENGRKSRYYSDRLFINTGNRTFKKWGQDLPRENGSCAVAADYDKDGDLDIFVGGASRPEEYPLPASSMLLRNDTDRADQPVLTNLAETELPELKSLGIVRSALWSDYDNDGWIDLLVVGEFMPFTIFKNEKGRLRKVDPDLLPKEHGLWNSINGGDFDRDGDIDYILGNVGLNSKYSPSLDNPLTLYAKDFDGNGTIDPIMTRFSGGKEVPVHLRDDLYKQLNTLKKIMPTYAQYAGAGIDELIPRSELNKALTLKWNYSSNAYLINDGDGRFRLESLPNRAQIAPIYGTLIRDFNGDDRLDILAVGNSHSAEVFSGWFDASVGSLLLGKGDGTFDFSPSKKSGFYVDGDAKAIVDIKRADTSFLTLISLNNDNLQSYHRSSKNKVSVIALQPFDAYAEIIYASGEMERREFYYGAGYLSQGSRSIILSDAVESVKIFNSMGVERLMTLD